MLLLVVVVVWFCVYDCGEVNGSIRKGSNADSGDDLPSFLFILGDDIGWADLSYNNGTAYTPNLDALAKANGSVLFQDFHSGGTVCSPTRATILTGRNHFRDCVDFVYDCSDMTECVPDFLFAPKRTFTVGDALRTITSASLGESPYYSGFFGKWHLGSFYNDSSKYGGVYSSPITHGFDYFNATLEVAPTATTNCNCNSEWKASCMYGHYNGTNHCYGDDGPDSTNCCFNYWHADSDAPHGVSNITNPTPPDDTNYITDSFGRFIASRAGKPFFAQLSFHNCHIPYIGTSSWRDLCERGISCKPGRYSDAQLDFYACLNELDDAVGRVMDILEQFNYKRNTMTWISTDNGPEGVCTPNGWCTPDFFKTYPGSAGPLRGRKRDIWEGGHRVPGIVHWPAVVTDNYESWDTVVSTDFLATIMDVMNISRPTSQQYWAFDGMSILPILKGESFPLREVGWMFQNPLQQGLRFGRWKLVNNSRGCDEDACKKPMLFDLETDLGETTDISASYPAVFAVMQDKLKEWREGVEISRSIQGCPPFSDTLLPDII
eukprot:m.25605 g.25605  ORF g.25605 m.25605 type:complete len:548 (+) comp5782_c0_seq2:46-1689(+)